MKKIFSSFLLASSLLFAEVTTVPTVNKTPITIDIQGEHIDFSGYKGKYVLLEFFGTHCPICMMEIGHLRSMQENNPELEVIAVELQDTDEETLKDFIFENEINYPVVSFKNAAVFYNYLKSIAPNWQGGIPILVLFDKNGDALTYFQGVVAEDDILKSIKEYSGFTK